MKIEIQNLGPIHHFEFDLEKDLHLLYGENNVGKSFAVNVVYCVLEAFLQEGEWVSNLDFHKYNAYWENLFNSMSYTDKYNGLNSKMIAKIRYSPTQRIDISEEFKDMLFYFLDETLVKNINSNFNQTYSNNLKNYLNDETSGVKIDAKDFNLYLKYRGDSGFYVAELIHEDLKSLIEGYIEGDEVNYSLAGVAGTNATILEHRFGFDMSSGIYRNIARSPKRRDIFILPSSRSGLNVFFNKIGYSTVLGPNFSKPISDYFDNLFSINLNNRNFEFDMLIKLFENIFNGKISIESGSKKIIYTPDKGDEIIPIENAASMVSELAPFVLHLLFLINRRSDKSWLKPPLLIIEEPEAHLHPKVQVQLMEIFAELTKHNVKVILTSHSNYMFNQLSNMLLKKEITPEKVGVYHMVMTDKGSIVKPDMQATEEGIEDHNFAGVAQKLYQERLETYEALNEDTDADK